MSQKIFLLTFKGICMNFLLELIFFILSHPVTSKQPHKIVQIHMGHPVVVNFNIKSFQYTLLWPPSNEGSLIASLVQLLLSSSAMLSSPKKFNIIQ